jgi:glycosyltransferase involved in cell wall biosynthesis
VIIPVYNRMHLLKEAILSVMEQTYRPIECIVVDDGSTDNIKMVVDDCVKEIDIDFSIIYLRQRKLGVQFARNFGLNCSRGEYVQFLDSDDILYPHKIENQVECFTHNPHIDAVYGDVDVGTLEKSEIRSYVEFNNNELIKKLVSEEVNITTHSILYSREIINKVGGWDTDINKCQEIDLQLNCLINGAKFHYLSLNTGLWRMHDGDRIVSNFNGLELVKFKQKWEKILSPIGFFTNDIRNKIASDYMWFASQYPRKSNCRILIKEAVRLNNEIIFWNQRKMRLLRFVTGNRIALCLFTLKFRIIHG